MLNKFFLKDIDTQPNSKVSKDLPKRKSKKSSNGKDFLG